MPDLAPKLMRDGAIVEDRWQATDIQSLEAWLALPDKAGTAVQLEPDQPPAPLLAHLAEIELVAINFITFMDGRGFSYARELRDHGFAGELRAVGGFIPDQLHYLQRCGFDSFEIAGEVDLEDALAQLSAFSEHYQASADKPQPLFRRRL